MSLLKYHRLGRGTLWIVPLLVGLHHVGNLSIGIRNTNVFVLQINIVIQNGFFWVIGVLNEVWTFSSWVDVVSCSSDTYVCQWAWYKTECVICPLLYISIGPKRVYVVNNFHWWTWWWGELCLSVQWTAQGHCDHRAI